MSKFKQMEGALEKKGYSEDSAARITAAHGNKVYGKQTMQKAAQAGVSAAAMKRRLEKQRSGQ